MFIPTNSYLSMRLLYHKIVKTAILLSRIAVPGASGEMLFLWKRTSASFCQASLPTTLALFTHSICICRANTKVSPHHHHLRKKIKGHKMCPFLAQAVRFELTCRLRQTDFESAPLWPLRYACVLNCDLLQLNTQLKRSGSQNLFCESTAHARSKSSASLLVSDRPKHKPMVWYACVLILPKQYNINKIFLQ